LAPANIRRGLVKPENELRVLLKEESIFLVETDTQAVKSNTNYKIEGYETILHKVKKTSEN
jgi:hypothetical protein